MSDDFDIDRFSGDELNRMRRLLDSINGPYVTKTRDTIFIGPPPNPPQRTASGNSGNGAPIPIRITASENIDTYLWQYTGRRQTQTETDTNTDADAVDLTLWNDMENANPSIVSGAYPIGIRFVDIAAGVCEILPFGPGAIVHCIKVGSEYRFSAANSVGRPL